MCQLCEDIKKIRKALSFISTCSTQIEKEEEKKRLHKEKRRIKCATEDEDNDGHRGEDEEDEGDEEKDSDRGGGGGGGEEEEEEEDGDSDSGGGEEEDVVDVNADSKDDVEEIEHTEDAWEETAEQRLVIGDWLLIEPYNDPEEVWLARAVQFKMNDIGCLKKYDKRRRVIGHRVDPGDHLIAVQYFEQVGEPTMTSTGNYKTFEMGVENVDYVNSSELRHARFDMEKAVTRRVGADTRRSSRVATNESSTYTWRLSRKTEEEAIRYYR